MSAQKANNTKEKVRELQRKLYLAAKANSKRRFHVLYDKVYRADILMEAWKRIRSNGGVGGIDGVSIADVEKYGIDRFIQEMQQQMKEGKYHPKPVKRSYIPKSGSKNEKRPLGIPVIKDRIIQMATKMVIEPIFEADFKECSYGFRPKRNAHQALKEVRLNLYKRMVVVDADIKGYFDSINHEKLMMLIKQRISDKRILKLIWKWLKAGIMVDGKYEENEKGSPQGGVISPLLSNIYLDYMDRKWEKHYSHLGMLVRYADDFVILCKRTKEAEEAMKNIRGIMERLELTIHGEKTKIVNLWNGKEGFDFLGFHHRRNYTKTEQGEWYVQIKQFPSKKAMNKMRQNMREVFAGRSKLSMSIEQLIEITNPKIRGMRNYYGLKGAKEHLNKIDWYIATKFTIWYNHKRKNKVRHNNLGMVMKLLKKHGLQKLTATEC